MRLVNAQNLIFLSISGIFDCHSKSVICSCAALQICPRHTVQQFVTHPALRHTAALTEKDFKLHAVELLYEAEGMAVAIISEAVPARQS